MSTIHKLNTDPTPFAALRDGRKKAEVRYNDRGFQVGDVLLLQETVYTSRQMSVEGLPRDYTGREMTFIVTHIQAGYGLPTDIVVLSLEPTWHTVAHATATYQD